MSAAAVHHRRTSIDVIIEVAIQGRSATDLGQVSRRRPHQDSVISRILLELLLASLLLLFFHHECLGAERPRFPAISRAKSSHSLGDKRLLSW